eukprot:TRINITY_DN20512_c0_g1_i1.p1 TRINITY_DN20512_c0_g1~~TRINITY_DN20512_c0_g1_i1.p1  ORF type:complete len:442 (-),score=152.69 TRINITY_DN20512_c0_g1_i1:1587-2912(-)
MMWRSFRTATMIFLVLMPALLAAGSVNTANFRVDQSGGDEETAASLRQIEHLLGADSMEEAAHHSRYKRNSDRGVTNLDIRAAILQLVNVIRDGSKKTDKANFEIINKIDKIESTIKSQGSSGVDKKIDNISTFLLRMNNKIDSLSRERGGRQSSALLETLAQESYDMITLLPTYIENTRTAILALGNDTKTQFREVESLLIDDGSDDKQSLKKVLKSTEENILQASTELKEIVVESGNMAESLFERVDSGYKELEEEIKGLSNVEQVLLDTADSVMDTKRKIEFGVQQIIFKVSELIELSGGEMDDNLATKFESITRTILSNQTQALTNLTSKVEKEIGQVWRQLGIMYGQLSNSIGILEKVKDQTETYVSKTDKNLGSMDNQVEGLTDRMSEVDDNLNYMLGQLSLVVQEFNQVKTGLGEAMDGIGDELLELKTKEGEK